MANGEGGVRCVGWFIWDARKGCVLYLFSIVRLVHRLVEKIIPFDCSLHRATNDPPSLAPAPILVTNPLESHSLRVVPLDMWQLRKKVQLSAKTASALIYPKHRVMGVVGTKGLFDVLNDQVVSGVCMLK